MTEKLLQYIWQFQYFNRSNLVTTTGEELQIISPGSANTDQGPDFSNARVKIGNAVLAGSIELHIKTSDWEKHKHGSDANYNNVILHVVLENDVEQRTSIPVLELQSRIPKLLLHNYEHLMNNSSFIPCANSIQQVKDITWQAWKERLLAERLTRKSIFVLSLLEANNFHWEETFWLLLARNFGIKVNADAFEQMAKETPLNVLAKHKNQIHQVEALLMGQAGLLHDSFKESYPQLLHREYIFLKTKYKLQPIHTPVHFLRMRPQNFPPVRLAQLAMLVHTSTHLFTKLLEADSLKEIKKWLHVTANDYWHYHYRFDEPSEYNPKKLGSNMIDNIIINTLVPLLFTYGKYHNEEKFKLKALNWLENVKAENNAVTSGFDKISVINKSAYDSQALIEMKNEYCNNKRCLQCSVGNAILKNHHVPSPEDG
ncbi:MAG: DUF2851 family protein [Chitinophagaceae bacterium]